MDADAFRDQVLEFLREEFPGEEFIAAERPEVVQWKGTEISLQNLHADLRREKISEAAFRTSIVEHFRRLMQLTAGVGSLIPDDWDTARPLLRLQLMPASFHRPESSVTFPFLDDVLVSVVCDAEFGYAYVREEDVVRWQVNHVDLYESARDGLMRASAGVGGSFIEGPPALLAIATGDGYDAARLLLPEIRQFVISKLGTPFYAGIPNRDFLIMWSADCDDAFHARISGQVKEDGTKRSHPLTDKVLTVELESIKPAKLRP